MSKAGQNVLKFLFQETKQYWNHILLIFLINLVAIPLSLATPIPIKIAIDYIIGNRELPTFVLGSLKIFSNPETCFTTIICFLYFMLLLFNSLQAYMAWYYQSYVGEKMVKGLRSKLFSHVQKLSLKLHSDKGSPALLYNLQNDVFNVQYILIYGIIPFGMSVISFISMSLIIYSLDWQLATIALVALPLLWIIGHLHVPYSQKCWAKAKDSEQKTIGVIQEGLNCIKTIKVFGGESRKLEHFNYEAGLNLKNYCKAIKTDTSFGILTAAVIATVSSIVLYMGILHVKLNTISTGSFFLIISYIFQLLKSLESASKQVTFAQSSFVSAKRIFSLFQQEIEPEDNKNSIPLKKVKGFIEFRNVSYSYNDGKFILKDLSFSIRAGEKVAIIGPSGAGKTTLLNLLMRFFDPQYGIILLDGVNIRSIKLSDLRKQFAVVLQETVLFSEDLASNIAYSSPKAGMGEIIKAAQFAGIHNSIMKMPLQYKTNAGEMGFNLSGGERQRLSIARAFLSQAPVLVMDEPTSALDSENEATILSSLQELQKGKTTLTITHNYNLVKDYDLLIRLNNQDYSVKRLPINMRQF